MDTIIINLRRYTSLLLVSFLVINTAACTSLSYYAQSIHGQLEILQKRESIDALLARDELPESISIQLSRVRQIRNFASAELGLPDNDSYRDYADLERDYVVWNVFATPDLSLKPLQWCFLIAGCLQYRGYFSEDAAREYAQELERQGYDVFVGGVAAYSTLGWFDDPVLNTMLRWDEAHLAKVIYHELAHQKIYIKDDTEFNEAFADTVALIGVQRWLDKFGKPSSLEKFKFKQSRENAFVDLVLTYRDRLDILYKSSEQDAAKRTKKAMLLGQMKKDYGHIRADWGDYDAYDAWFNNGLNNAKLMAVAIYRDYLPGFRNLLTKVNNDLDAFYTLAGQLGHCTAATRRHILITGQTQFEC
ncbi:MAG: hypothetical protein HW411_153 [Gammaproteobacteria bacterium]|nr:hypothetical protein [Gammaproteobacteria bacterium]